MLGNATGQGWRSTHSSGRRYPRFSQLTRRGSSPLFTVRLVGKHAQTEFGENLHTQKDPGFVDAARLNFQLKDDSVVYQALPGFKRIPFERIGPRSSAVRE